MWSLGFFGTFWDFLKKCVLDHFGKKSNSEVGAWKILIKKSHRLIMQILGISDFFFFWKKVIRPFWRKSLVPDSPTTTGVGTLIFFLSKNSFSEYEFGPPFPQNSLMGIATFWALYPKGTMFYRTEEDFHPSFPSRAPVHPGPCTLGPQGPRPSDPLPGPQLLIFCKKFS